MKKGLKWKNIIILVLVGYIVISFVRQEMAIRRIEDEISQKQTELEKLKDENVRLEEQVKNANSDDYIEKLARERLGMLKPGEIIVSDKKGDSNSNK
ncbi:MAG: FtsB family cell division protein [Clostridium chrysemydis]|uniref:FtsB family cell division protein n=1 Tax=Clostridium TaxID=1485 RepID=UPI00188485CD|nr:MULTISPECIES: septum formation initiator family protein [Clostridium]MCR6515038.1 septum formation initiator family protein [Clostridium sp. LY3-2]